MFNDDSEMICRQFISEVNDDIDLPVDVSSHHVNSTAQDSGRSNADIERCIETIGNDVGSLHFTLCLYMHLLKPPQPFYGPFSGTTRVSQCQKRTSGLLYPVGRGPAYSGPIR